MPKYLKGMEGQAILYTTQNTMDHRNYMSAFQFGTSKFQKQFTSNPFPKIPTFLIDYHFLW